MRCSAERGGSSCTFCSSAAWERAFHLGGLQVDETVRIMQIAHVGHSVWTVESLHGANVACTRRPLTLLALENFTKLQLVQVLVMSNLADVQCCALYIAMV